MGSCPLEGVYTVPMQLDPVRLAAALQELGVTPAALQAVRMAPPEKAKLMLDELKAIAKARYRKLAFELHPDRTNGDPAKTEKFTFLSQVIKQIEAMEYRAAPPPPPMMRAPQPGPPVRQVQVRQVVFRAVPAVSIHHRPGAPAAGPASEIRGPRGVHVVFLRPT